MRRILACLILFLPFAVVATGATAPTPAGASTCGHQLEVHYTDLTPGFPTAYTGAYVHNYLHFAANGIGWTACCCYGNTLPSWWAACYGAGFFGFLTANCDSYADYWSPTYGLVHGSAIVEYQLDTSVDLSVPQAYESTTNFLVGAGQCQYIGKLSPGDFIHCSLQWDW